MKPPQYRHFTPETLRKSATPELREIGAAFDSGADQHPFAVDDFEAMSKPGVTLPETAVEAAAHAGASRFNVQLQPVRERAVDSDI